MSRRERGFSDHELSRPAQVLARRLVQRWDVHARQLDNGNYICVHQLLNVEHLFAHLRGEITLGAYLLDQSSRARFVVLDADDERGWGQLIQLSKSLAAEDVPTYLEHSRRGGHLWLFLAQTVDGRAVRAFGRGLLAAHQIEGVELYPRQERLVGGPGSLIRMPFGIHRLTGRRYGFYTPDGQPLAATIREQIDILNAAEVVPVAAFDTYRSYAPSQTINATLQPPERASGAVSGRIKASITVLEFVSQYVDLKLTASGAIGLCPFHNDHHPSFGVNASGNYWHCFAGCGGGSLIDFWMRWQDCDFTTAVTELADLLL